MGCEHLCLRALLFLRQTRSGCGRSVLQNSEEPAQAKNVPACQLRDEEVVQITESQSGCLVREFGDAFCYLSAGRSCS